MAQWTEFYRLYAAELTLAALILGGVLVLWMLWLQRRFRQLTHQYRAAMSGVEGVDREGWLASQKGVVEDHTERVGGLERQVRHLTTTVTRHAGRVGIVRFNPFEDSGGDQSFSIAWIDDEANGVVISSLHSRTGVRLYAKPVEAGDSSYNLSEEEEQAIQIARNGGSA